jgi:hypothetical protein
MKRLTSQIAAVAVAGALLAAGITGTAQSASADQISGTPTITLHGQATNSTTEGPVITTGSLTDSPMFWGLNVSQGCPTGFQGRSDTFVFQNGAKIANLSTSRNSGVQLYGHTGLDGNPIGMDDTYSYPAQNPFANNVGLGDPKFALLVAGAFDIRIYCSASSSSIDLVNDKYFDLPMTLSSSGIWSDVPAAAKVAPTVSLTAVKNNTSGTDTTVTLTATVKGATGATATGALGTVNFFSPAGTPIGSGTVTNGVATYVTGANTVGTYSYTAQYLNASDPVYSDSVASGASTVTFTGPNAAQTTTSVTIPAGSGTLTLSGVPSTVSLGTATLTGGLLTASAALGTITVNDTRQTGSPIWNLSGQSSDFTSGTNSFNGGYLGWTPTLVGTSNAGVAGAAVISATGAGLKGSAQSLATGGVVVGTPTTTVGAQLNLAVPAQTTAGVYTSTLTITLA